MHPQSITDSSFQQKFFSRLRRVPSGCLEWQGCICGSGSGYGSVWVGGKMQMTHRVAWIIAHGPIHDGECVLHHCDNPLCCDIDHLFLGTLADNTRDMIAKGRAWRIKSGNRGKLTPEEVTEICRVYVPGSREFGQGALAKRFGVHQTHIGWIVRSNIMDT